MAEKIRIGILGGTGVEKLPGLTIEEERKIYTPFGNTSSKVMIGTLSAGGKEVKIAFISRHGPSHSIPPHKINARANFWAFKQLGVERVISPAAVGSLRPEIEKGHFVIPDQILDFTRNRIWSFYQGGVVAHVSVADPYCPELRKLAYESASKYVTTHNGGTFVCIEGPRFSTRAESRMFRMLGGDIIGMTVSPEFVLAREMEMCFVSIAMVTDYDVWAGECKKCGAIVELPGPCPKCGGEVKPLAVTNEEVLETMKQNSENLTKVLVDLIPRIPEERTCECAHAMEGATL